LVTRVQALARLAAGDSLEQAAPQCLAPDRIADPATVRRWFWRRIVGLGFSLRFLFSPTILAWDFRAASRILIVEPLPP
jgi:hypothetical protein